MQDALIGNCFFLPPFHNPAVRQWGGEAGDSP